MSSFASIGLALLLALLLGPILGRLATQWLSGSGLSNLLVEVRGAFVPFVVAPLLFILTGWTPWLVIGTVVGLMQGIAVARWIVRRSGEWAPEMQGGIALGRSKAALASKRATARGAVVGTLASVAVHVIFLEAILSALSFPGIDVTDTLGASLQQGSAAAVLLFILAGTVCVIVSEGATAWLLQRRTID
jgi:hypothetical protein